MRCPCCNSEVDLVDPELALAAIQLSPSERTIAETLAAQFGRVVHADKIASALYSLCADGGALNAHNTISVMIWRMRPKLTSVGLTIEADVRGSRGRRMKWQTPREVPFDG